MKPCGKTYLIEIHKKPETIINGIIVPDNSNFHDIYYEGKVVEYGTGWDKDEIKDLIPIGKTVIFEYKKKCGIKFVFGEKIFYIHEPKNILAMKNEEN